MNSNIYFDYLNNYYLNIDYLNSIELFRYKYEIFLCTSSIIIIGIFSVIFNKMNKLNKKLEKKLMDLQLTVNIHDDNLRNNNNKIIKNYDTLNEENKKLHEEILNLNKIINVHESALTQNNNKIKDFETETINIQQKIVECHKKIVSISENNKENKLYSLQLKELLDNHQEIVNDKLKFNFDNFCIFGVDSQNKNILVNKYINHTELIEILSSNQNCSFYLEQIKLLLNIKEIKLSEFLPVSGHSNKFILEFNYTYNKGKSNYFTISNSSQITAKIDINNLKMLEDFLMKCNKKLIIDIDIENVSTININYLKQL